MKKYHDSVCIPTRGVIRKNYHDLLQRCYWEGGGRGGVICIQTSEIGINRRDLVFHFTPITVFDRPEAASVPCQFQVHPPVAIPSYNAISPPSPGPVPPTQYFPPLKSDTRHCHSHGPSLLPVPPIFNFLRPLHPTPFTIEWMLVPCSGRFIRLCDRIQHGHRTCLAFHTAVRSDPTRPQHMFSVSYGCAIGSNTATAHV